MCTGSLLTVVVFYAYHKSYYKTQETTSIKIYAHANLLQGIGYGLFIWRNELPSLLSVNVGNTLVFLGMYYEAIAMYHAICENKVQPHRKMTAIAVSAIILFNVVEFLHPTPATRVLTASLCIFLIMAFPVKLIFSATRAHMFKWLICGMYSLLLLMTLPRAYNAWQGYTSLYTKAVPQALFFIVLVLLMISSLVLYLFFLREKDHKLIELMASTDMLTGLSNRYHFFKTAEIIFQTHLRSKQALTLMFLDIDHFKKINDTYGHDFGDQVLRAFGGVIVQSKRTSDVACRYGGEEFLLLLAGTATESAYTLGNRLMQAVSAIKIPDNTDFHFTITIGLCGGIPQKEDSLEDFIKKADSALYLGKGSGRNKIVNYTA